MASGHEPPGVMAAMMLEHHPHIMKPLPKLRQGSQAEPAACRQSTLWRMPLDFSVMPRLCMGYSTASHSLVMDGLLEMAQQRHHHPLQQPAQPSAIYPTPNSSLVVTTRSQSAHHPSATIVKSSCAILPSTSRITAHPPPSADKAPRNRPPSLLKCPYCPKKCHNEESLLAHRTECQLQRVHSCPQCGKRFKAKGGLQQHYRIHLNEKPYQCHFCPKRFTQKSHVDQHERIHTGSAPSSLAMRRRMPTLHRILRHIAAQMAYVHS